MANNLDALLKTVIGSFNQPETKAITWATALKECFITSQSQLTDLLKVDRTEKEAGRGDRYREWCLTCDIRDAD